MALQKLIWSRVRRTGRGFQIGSTVDTERLQEQSFFQETMQRLRRLPLWVFSRSISGVNFSSRCWTQLTFGWWSRINWPFVKAAPVLQLSAEVQPWAAFELHHRCYGWRPLWIQRDSTHFFVGTICTGIGEHLGQEFHLPTISGHVR